MIQRCFLPRGDRLLLRGDEIDTVYLPVTADISNLTRLEGGDVIMSANVGREGVTGLAAFLAGQPIAWDLVVQVEGDAIAIPADALRARAEESSTLRAALLRLTHFHQIEAAQNTLCAARHPVSQRFARFLLELHDRTGKVTFEITQAEIAERLAAQRTTINTESRALSAGKTVRWARGKVSILDFDALTHKACDCYTSLRASRYWPLQPNLGSNVGQST